MQQGGGNRTRNKSKSRKSNASSRRDIEREVDVSWNSTTPNSAPIGWNIRNATSGRSRDNIVEDYVASRPSYGRYTKSQRVSSSERYNSSQLSGGVSKSLTPSMAFGTGLCRTEEVEVVLEAFSIAANAESRRHGANPFGFTLQPASSQTRLDEPLADFPLIASVTPGGPAFRSGVIQAGDSLLAIQGDSPLGKTIDKLTARYLLHPPLEASSSSSSSNSANRRLFIVTQYTVAENVIPSSGVFDVRIIKRSASLGINLQASRRSRPGEPLLISKVIPGSVASRCGSISPGDILLAVNGVSLEACSITDAARLLQTSEEIVTLRIQKPNGEAVTLISDEGEGALSYSQSDLEIVRDDDNDFSLTGGGPFGMNNTQNNGFLSQSADESISHQPAPPPRPPRLFRGQKVNRIQQQVHGGGFSRNLSHKLESESWSDERRGNPSDSFSSDRLSENMFSDTLFEVHKVRLTRAHSSSPWGVVISGTDDVVDVPVYIDSLTPGKPAAISGLLRRGDRILAVDGLDGAAPKLAGGAGLTLSLVTARLQQPFKSVTLYIAREKSRSDFTLPSSTLSTSALSQANSSGIVRQYSWGTSGSPATEFNHSFDDLRVQPPPPPSLRAVPSKSSATASTSRLKKQNSISKGRPYPRHFTGVVGFPNIADAYKTNFTATSYLNIGRPTELPRQTVDAYLSKDEESASFHQHHHRHQRSSHSRRLKAYRSGRHYYRHRKEEDEEEGKNLQKENDRQRASSTLNLDAVSCPGCRKAVVKEVLAQQRLLNEQRSNRSNTTRRRGHLRSRGRSLEIIDVHDVIAEPHRTHQHSHQPPKPIPLDIKSPCNGRGSCQNLSRSDSRLNRKHFNTGNGNDEGPGSSSDNSADKRVPNYSVSSSHSSSYTSASISGFFSKSNSSRNSSLSSADQLEVERISASALTPPFSNGRPRSHRSTETLPRLIGNSQERRSATPTITKPRLHRSASRKNHTQSWRGWIRLVKPDPGDSFGIGLSKSLSSRGIYVSAIRPGSVAETSGLLQAYDRILKVNELSTKGRTCREVVAIIQKSSPVLNLLIHRRH